MDSNNDIDADQTLILREHLETSKQRARVYREWAYFVIAVLVAISVIVALRSWKNGNDMAGALNARAMGILDKFDAKLDTVNVQGVNDLLASTKGRVDDLAPLQRELTALTATTARNADKLTIAAVARINQVGENLTSLKGVTDEGQRTLTASTKAIGDISGAAVKVMDRFDLTATEAQKAIADSAKQLNISIEAMTKLIGNPKWDALIENALKVSNETSATVVDFHKDLHDTMDKMPAIAADIQSTTHEIKRFSRVSIVVSILSRLASALIPGLLN